MVEERLIMPQKISGDEEFNRSIRPQKLTDFIGQKQACDNLRVFIQAAKVTLLLVKKCTVPGFLEIMVSILVLLFQRV